jgi:hypothetical protein
MLRPGQFYVISSALGVTGFALLVRFFPGFSRAVCRHSDCDHVRVRLLAIFFDWRTRSVMRPPLSNYVTAAEPADA